MYGGELSASKKKLMIVGTAITIILVMTLVYVFFLKDNGSKCKDGYTYRESDKKCVGWIKKPNEVYQDAVNKDKNLNIYVSDITLDKCITKCNDDGCDNYAYTEFTNPESSNLCFTNNVPNGIKYEVDRRPATAKQSVVSYLFDTTDPV